jgi:uncharacterized protein
MKRFRSINEAYASVVAPSSVVPATTRRRVDRLAIPERLSVGVARLVSVASEVMTLKGQLEADMRAAMKARDELLTSTLRMAITAVRNAEVAGTAARELSDDEVLAVLTKEAKKRREAATAFADAGRAEQAAKERAEEEILARYLPSQLSDEELAGIVKQALASGDFAGMKSMGPAMKAAQAAVAGRAEGGRVAAEVRKQLAG